jgi:hypothetical protein
MEQLRDYTVGFPPSANSSFPFLPSFMRRFKANLRPLPADHTVTRRPDRFNVLLAVCGGTVAETRVLRTVEAIYGELGANNADIKVRALHFLNLHLAP